MFIKFSRGVTSKIGSALVLLARLFAYSSKKLNYHGKKLCKKTHHHVAKKPHQRLMDRDGHYARWHNWQHHRKIHHATLAVYILAIGTGLVMSYQRVLAVSNLVENWNFANMSNYTYDSTAVEQSGTSARLKAQNYTTDANTMALYHMDENSGVNAADSSTNANEATLKTSSWNTGNLNNGVSLNVKNFKDMDSFELKKYRELKEHKSAWLWRQLWMRGGSDELTKYANWDHWGKNATMRPISYCSQKFT